jgi:hypothetical protein
MRRTDMRLAMMILAVALLASTTEVLAQDSGKGRVPPYYYFIKENCPGKNLEVTLKNDQKLSGRCHAQLADHFQLTHEGVTYEIFYINIETITVRRSWFGKLRNTVVGPYVYIQTSIGMAQFFNDFP